MPTYDYKCNECGITREVIREIGDNTEPLCCDKQMARLWSAPAIKFNATGFYSTGG